MADFTIGPKVPYVSQKNFGDPDDPRTEETGCWYACISMIGYYFEAGPRLGVPELYTLKKTTAKGVDYMVPTVMLTSYPELMKNEDLVSVPLPKSKSWTADALVSLLKAHGPMYVRRGFVKQGKLTGGHAIVLVGARSSDNRAIFHDPGSRGANWECRIAEFNQFFKWSDNLRKHSLMYKRSPQFGATEATRTIADTSGAFGGTLVH